MNKLKTSLALALLVASSQVEADPIPAVTEQEEACESIRGLTSSADRVCESYRRKLATLRLNELLVEQWQAKNPPTPSPTPEQLVVWMEEFRSNQELRNSVWDQYDVVSSMIGIMRRQDGRHNEPLIDFLDKSWFFQNATREQINEVEQYAGREYSEGEVIQLRQAEQKRAALPQATPPRQKWLGIVDILTDDVKGFSSGYCWSYATEEECMEDGRQTYGHDKIFRHVCIKAEDISKWDVNPDEGGKQRPDLPPDECFPPPS